jgi:hypothetical protein
MGPETPNPIAVRVLRGECDLGVVRRDVLGLTKINFNSCLHNDRLPVTIRFASEVGDVLVAAPIEGPSQSCRSSTTSENLAHASPERIENRTTLALC